MGNRASSSALIVNLSFQPQSRVVVPCTLSENLSIEWYARNRSQTKSTSWNLACNRINTVFDTVVPPPTEIYLGIVSDDSSIVYYKLSKGMVKPPQ